jgi:hypothetical protein
MKIIEFTKTKEIPYELGEPDYSYFEDVSEEEYLNE